MAGPQLNIIDDVAQEVNKVNHDYDDLGVEPKDLYKKATIDGVFAFGLGVNVSSHFVFSANARFDYGFQDVENKSKTRRCWSCNQQQTNIRLIHIMIKKTPASPDLQS